MARHAPQHKPLAWLATLPDRLRLIWPILRLGWYDPETRDPWTWTRHPVPLWMFGPGCVKDFAWYLEGESRVAVADLDGLCRWLAGCAYVSDESLFRTDDYWQHPATFEQIRKGDCDDHALWAWRKLAALGYESEFMVGERRWPGETPGMHAWVAFRDGARPCLLEGTGNDPGAMILSLDDAREIYRPHVGVDHTLTRKLYRGFLEKLDRP